MVSGPNRILQVVTIALLSVTVARLYGLSSDQWTLMRRTQERQSKVLDYGSLSGYDIAGRLIRPSFPDVTHLVLFVIHSDRQAEEVNYWNAVVQSINNSRVQFWGVCDAGSACTRANTDLRISIIGFMDPYQMRNLAAIDEKGDFAVYDRTGTIKSRIKRAGSPAVLSLELAKVLQ